MNKKAESVQKEKAKLQKKAPRSCSKKAQSQAATTSGTHLPTANNPPDSNGAFILDDYQNICSYLEEERNYKQLYGTGTKEDIGASHLTKAAAYDVFSIYMNDHSTMNLHLTGKQLCQRMDQ